MTDSPEFSRLIDIRQADGPDVVLQANDSERSALSTRFDLVRIDTLESKMRLTRDGQFVLAEGTLTAMLVQRCAVSGDDLPATVTEPIRIRFIPAAQHTADEVELTENQLDEIEYIGTSFDLGEAVAQSLALAIDPFATGPRADKVRHEAGLLGQSVTGPFAALKGLMGE